MLQLNNLIRRNKRRYSDEIRPSSVTDTTGVSGGDQQSPDDSKPPGISAANSPPMEETENIRKRLELLEREKQDLQNALRAAEQDILCKSDPRNIYGTYSRGTGTSIRKPPRASLFAFRRKI